MTVDNYYTINHGRIRKTIKRRTKAFQSNK